MQFHRAVVAALLPLSLLLLTATAHNITEILSISPEFSTFNDYLTQTHLAEEIDNRETITVLAVDNDGMTNLLSQHLTLAVIRNVLSLHVLLDYFDATKLHQITNGTALAATMFQATGAAPGSSGFVNITDMKGGKITFTVQDSPTSGSASAFFVKSIKSIPYNISVIQISSIITYPEADAPAPEPSQVNLTSILSAHNCKLFAQTLLSNPAAEQTFDSNIEGGLSIFCPGDEAMKSFVPKYNNLTADGKQALLEYHGVPVYQSLPGWRANNGATNTLATDGAKKFDFTVQNDGERVTIETKIVTATVVNTVIDQMPLAIYEVDKVLLPAELFKKGDLSPAPAPAPETPADAPAAPAPPVPADISPAPAPAEAPEADAADQTGHKKKNGGVKKGGKIGGVILSVWFVFLQLL